MVLIKPMQNKSVESDDRQFGGISGTSTRDVLVELVHTWYKPTDTFNSCIRVVMLDFSKVFDLIIRYVLLQIRYSRKCCQHIFKDEWHHFY